MSGRALLRLGGIDPASKEGDQIIAALALEDGPDPTAFAALVEIADQFLRSGGSWSPALWSDLAPIERAACVEAGDRVDARRAQRIAVLVAMAQQDKAHAADLAAAFDGGAMREEVAVEAALSGAESEAVHLVSSGG